jgi:hypothetical protein
MTLATEGKPDSKAERAARRAEARAAKRKAEEETADRRRKQLDAARLITAKIDERLQTARGNTRRYEGLSSQLTGFYEELDKLTKGKAMLEVTDLVVEKTNDVIRDAKGIIEGDTYLDRIKEFVPAGNNPIEFASLPLNGPCVFSRPCNSQVDATSSKTSSLIDAQIPHRNGSDSPMIGNFEASPEKKLLLVNDALVGADDGARFSLIVRQVGA